MTATDNSTPNLGATYSIEGEIGRGGMATVYRARDRRHSKELT